MFLCLGNQLHEPVLASLLVSTFFPILSFPGPGPCSRSQGPSSLILIHCSTEITASHHHLITRGRVPSLAQPERTLVRQVRGFSLWSAANQSHQVTDRVQYLPERHLTDALAAARPESSSEIACYSRLIARDTTSLYPGGLDRILDYVLREPTKRAHHNPTLRQKN
ncbi:hypothetical protein B0J13DRAFT_188429 [Dactylonectria estremocensis]|uniref:Uncharacterized protein n=1 Tax=Dactylonectria estremocensis TaxID=1079267 RepID=A0A9P9FCX4_9HYPO|nr:hypothetical protein B0J13DRAFT_188429 [Dactylonectria estremocensis]